MDSSVKNTIIMENIRSVSLELDKDILIEATKILQKHFNVPVIVKRFDFLRGRNNLNTLVRLFLVSETNVILPKSVILKQLSADHGLYGTDQFTRFSRDWATLKFLNDVALEHYVPQVFGGSQKYQFFLIEDLGKKHVSLVESLTLPDKDKAVAALLELMKTLGNFHTASFGKLDYYNVVLKEIYPEAINWGSDLDYKIDYLLQKLNSVHNHLGYPIDNNVLNEATEVIRKLFSPGPFSTLIHKDICPDNIFINQKTDKFYLIDFESAVPGNALIDATCLRMAMPTCWCAKAIPSDIIDFLENAYRLELQKEIPSAIDDNTYYESYTDACAFWVLNSMIFLEWIIDNERILPSGRIPTGSFWRRKENFVRPRFITRLIAFIQVSEKYGFLPNLRKMSINILKSVQSMWPHAKPLELYHPFKVNI